MIRRFAKKTQASPLPPRRAVGMSIGKLLESTDKNVDSVIHLFEGLDQTQVMFEFARQVDEIADGVELSELIGSVRTVVSVDNFKEALREVLDLVTKLAHARLWL